VRREQQAHKEFKGLLVVLALKEFKVPLEASGHKVFKASRVLLDRLGQQDLRAQPARQGRKALKAQRGRLVLREPQAAALTRLGFLGEIRERILELEQS
jgi:hypothetical protein